MEDFVEVEDENKRNIFFEEEEKKDDGLKDDGLEDDGVAKSSSEELDDIVFKNQLDSTFSKKREIYQQINEIKLNIKLHTGKKIKSYGTMSVKTKKRQEDKQINLAVVDCIIESRILGGKNIVRNFQQNKVGVLKYLDHIVGISELAVQKEENAKTVESLDDKIARLDNDSRALTDSREHNKPIDDKISELEQKITELDEILKIIDADREIIIQEYEMLQKHRFIEKLQNHAAPKSLFIQPKISLFSSSRACTNHPDIIGVLSIKSLGESTSDKISDFNFTLTEEDLLHKTVPADVKYFLNNYRIWLTANNPELLSIYKDFFEKLLSQ